MTRALVIAALAAVGCTAEIGGTPDGADAGDDAEDPRPQAPTGDPPGIDDPSDPCALAGVDEVGTCDGDGAITRCQDGQVVTERCAPGERCAVREDAPVCLTGRQACAGIGPHGRCDDDRLLRCDGGWPDESDCAAIGQVCGLESADRGYRCVDPAAAGARVVRGVIEYQDRPVSPGMLAPPTPAPARGVTVWLIRNADDGVVTWSLTSDDGSFVLRHDEADGESLRVVAGTRNDSDVRPLEVRRQSGNAHGFRSVDVASAGVAEVDVLVTEASDAAPAFNVFDRLIHGMDETRRLGATGIAPLVAEWQRGTGGGSYYQGGSNYLHLASGDGYDDVVILHEFGHYHQDEYAASDSPGGPHPSPGGDDPRLAWGEGEATYVAMALRGEPYYIDYDTDGGWWVDLEGRVHEASMSSSVAQYISEWMVAELMWDVADDGADTDGDPVTGGHDDALSVTMGYMRQTGSPDRGAGGADLVDWLDGWLDRVGTSACAELEQLVAGWYQFPYDFAACP